MLQIPMHVCDHSLKLLLLLQPGCLASGELNGGLPATTQHRFGTGRDPRTGPRVARWRA